MLQAYIDDSASDEGDRRLFLAGYINTAQRWSRFSEAWRDELRQAPSIAYLKMAEAANLSGEFRGWDATARDEKIRGLGRVVRHFKPSSIHCSISRRDCAEILQPVAPYGLGHPYGLCFQTIMVSLASMQAEQRDAIKVPIDFIFDEQEGLGRQARFFYDYVRDTQPHPIRKLLSKYPIFRDDKLVMPLQAADMLAWHIRRRHVEAPDKFQIPDFLSADGLHMACDIDADTLRSLAAKISMVPGVERVRNRSQWRKTFKEIRSLSALGVAPPVRLARWKNTLRYTKERLARFFRR